MPTQSEQPASDLSLRAVSKPNSTPPLSTSAPPADANTSATPQTPSSEPSPTAQMFDQSTGILMGLNISMLECLFVLMEFIFGTVIFPAVWRLVLQYPCSKLYPQYVCDEIFRVLGYFTVAYWLLHRCSWTILQSFPILIKHVQSALNPDLLTTPYPTTSTKPNHNVLYYFVGAHLISICFLLVLQVITGEQIYSLENFFVEDSTVTTLVKGFVPTAASNATEAVAAVVTETAAAVVDAVAEAATAEVVDVAPTMIFSLPRVAFLTLLAPLFEECVFRVVMLTFVHLRLAKYFPGRIQLTELIEQTRETHNKPKKTKKQIIVRRTKDTQNATTPAADAQDEDINDTSTTNAKQTPPEQAPTPLAPVQPTDAKYNVAPFNIPQYATVLSAVAFGMIHLINLINGYNTYYVILQAIVGVFIGIVLNAAAYQYGLMTALGIHIFNNVVSSFISQNTDIFASKLLTFGFFETILCYGVLAYLSLKNLSNTQSPTIPYTITTAPVHTDSTTPLSQVIPKPTEIATIPVPRHYQAFNNTFIHNACQQCDLPH